MKVLFLFLAMLLSVGLSGQNLDSLFNLEAYTAESELQKVLNQKTGISAGEALTTRENPGIISVITHEEIKNMGARDLTDILRLVPGFEIAHDLQFVTGLGLRGNWANEGKILVMVDGQEYNELMYQTVPILNRIPPDAIERIEIIRGPGSALYGGTAEYGVINIITKNASMLNGASAYANLGLHSSGLGRKNGGVMVGQTTEELHWDASFYTSTSLVSDQDYQDLYGDYEIANMRDIAKADGMNINAGLQYKGLSFRTIYDEYRTNDPFLFASFKLFFTDLKYEINAGNKVKVIPQIKYTRQEPWAYGDEETGEYELQARAERLHTSIAAVYDANRRLSFNFGTVYFRDKATDLLDSDYFGERPFRMQNYAVFAQGLLKHRLANITAGFRFEENSRAGAAFVPRLALTKKIQNFHFKTLYSQAFRTPGIENINIGIDENIKPEKSEVIELELGYQFTPEMLLTANAFRVKTRDVIVYFSEQISVDEYFDGYQNFERSGTSGVELLYSIRQKKWYSSLSYSYYAASKKNTVEAYRVDGQDRVSLGFPSHKITLNGSVSLSKNITFNPSMTYASKRYAYQHVEEDEEQELYAVQSAVDPYVLCNVFVNFRDLALKGLDVGVGVYDIFDQRPPIIQPYNGDYAPIPALSREFTAKLVYHFDFNRSEN